MKQQYTIKQTPSGNWRTQIRYTDENGESKRRSITAPTQWEVMKKADDFRKGIITETKRVTVEQAVRDYIDSRRHTRAASTIYGYETIAKNRLQLIMKKDIRELTKGDINRAIDYDASRGLGYKSLKEAVALLKSALDEKGVTIPSSKKFSLPPKPPSKGDLPELEQVIKILIGSSVELPCLLALWCGGMRISEVRGLQYRDIMEDADGRHYLSINRARVCINGHDVVSDVNKTELSTRIVPLPEYLYGQIMQKPHDSDDDFIIDESYAAVKRRYARLLEKNGVHMTFHELRAQFATTMNELGVDKKVLQQMGGWSNSVVLDKVYIRTPKATVNRNMLIFDAHISSLVQEISV